MKDNQLFWERFERVPIVGIIRGLDLVTISEILPRYVSSGLTTIEITMNTEAAEDIISYAKSNFGESLNVGAGTVCTVDELNKALDAGASFIVTPILNIDVVTLCADAGIPIFPGAFTPTEIYNAWNAGASMVKVYPATSLGVDYIRDVKAPLNKIKLLPTGGVSKSNIKDFLAAGASGVGIGSQLFDKELVKNARWDDLEAHFKEFTTSF